ncbi:MAG: peptidoglycan-binding protein, partial [Ruminococcus sp.]|nr:peptidoglycan-binding protein [Ruminococcus sp.]
VGQGNPSIPSLTVDGIFGPRTKAAVIAFQRSLGLEQNGAVGPAEWAELVIRGNNL